uniref:Putative pheromone protein n=1 Tax=Flammulina velutipes TaxID=38945 RepID=A0A6C0N1W2_FLAVE|nr:putative pheromone precursor protein [Flammulina velutipes]
MDAFIILSSGLPEAFERQEDPSLSRGGACVIV